jgi:predicted nucleic acid-binding protein
MPYLLDADWAIQALAGRTDAVATIRRLAPARIAISVVTVGEIYEGAFNSPNPGGLSCAVPPVSCAVSGTRPE